MAMTFNPISEKEIRNFFRSQKEKNKRFRCGEFIEAAIIDRMKTVEQKEVELTFKTKNK